jgi:MFS family permease
MVLVNTVVLVRFNLEFEETEVAVALGAFGGGSMLAALFLPQLLDKRPDRPVMIGGATVLVVTLLGLAGMIQTNGPQWYALLAGWVIIGIGYSMVLTPSGRLLKRSSHSGDRPAVYAAQFALSHACWLITYPLAGWLMTESGPTLTLAILAVLAVFGLMGGLILWPRSDTEPIEHRHDDLPGDHPHLRDGRSHSHPIVIDDYHPHWPRVGDVGHQ